MNCKEKSLCFSGHRSERLPQSKEQLEKLKDKLCKEVDKAIEEGFDTFYFGACYGFDLMCAQIVLKRKRVINLENPKIIKLNAIVPFEEQAKNWSDDDRELYYNTLAQCDDVIMLNTKYKPGCYFERNRYMDDRSSRLICYCDEGRGGTQYTVRYAEKNNVQVVNLYEKIK